MGIFRYFVFLLLMMLFLFLVSCSSGGSTGNPTGDSDSAESTDQSENEISQEDEEISQGLLSASPSEIRFGAVVLGDTSTETLTLTNDGEEDLTISVVRTSEATTPEFSVQTMLQGDQAIEVPVVLVPGQNLAINLQYAPVDAGSDTGTLQIIGQDFQGNLLEISLFADEKGESGLDVTPRLEFGYAGNIGEEETQSLTIWNLPEDPQSNRTLQVTKLELTQGSRDYRLDVDTCTASSQHPILIAPGQSHSCSVVFSPREAGELSGAIHIETNASEGEASGDVNLSGRCAPPETVLTLVVNPRGEPVPGAELRLWGENAVLATTDSRGRAVILPEDGGQIFAADGAKSLRGVYSRQYKQVLPEDEVSVFVVDLLPVESSQGIGLGQVSASNLPGALLKFSPEDVALPDGAGTALFMGEGHPSAAPYDLPEGKELVQMFHFGPDGTTFTNPAKLTLPNSLDLAPGEQIEFHSFDETTLLWEKAAVLEVNADGTLLETIEGGISHFSAGGLIQPEGSLPEYTVTGLVQDDLEQNLSDIHVFAMGARGRMLDDDTNSEGSYTISGIRVSCHKSPYLTVAASRNGTFLDDTLTSVVAEVTDDPSQTVQAPVLILPNNVAKGSIRGKALSPLGTPVENARVTVYPALGWDLYDQTDAQGRFVVSSVPAGTARVEIKHDGLGLSKEISGEVPENGTWNLGMVILDEVADTESPRMLWSMPTDGQENVVGLTEVRVVFNETIDAASLQATLKRSLTDETISGSATLENSTTVVFTPDVNFEDGRVYTFTLGAGLADLSGNVIGAEFTLQFLTVTPSCPDAECKSGIYIWGTESCGYEALANGTSCRNNHGSCNGNGECVCNNEYMTEDCSTCLDGFIEYPDCRDDPCEPDPCNDHGSCDSSDGSCTCDNAFMTADCSACLDGFIDYPDCRDDPCEPDPCNDHGSCDSSDGSCTCDNAFMTADCSACLDGFIEYPDCRDDPCEPDPCNDHGSCDSSDGSCTCDNAFMTADCSACLDGFIEYPDCRDDPCEPDPCNDHGSCDSSDGSCTCDNTFMTEDCSACLEGYIDYPDCRDDPCEPDPCNGHGTCDSADGSCTCNNEYMTEDCSACQEDYIDYPDCRDDPCEPDPCNGQGTCDQSNGSCTCNNEYMTLDCSACQSGYIEYPDCRDDPCEPDPCNNHGTCDQANGSCACDNQFMTTDCSACQDSYIDYPDCRDDLCDPDPCNGHGTCDSIDGSCTCNNQFMTTDCSACLEGYIDHPDCRDDPCEPDPCNGQGSCDQVDGSCSCINEYMAEECSVCMDGYVGYPNCHALGFVPIEAGTFWMGSPDGNCPAEYPGECIDEPGRLSDREELHEVTLTYDFEMQAHEVMEAEFEGVMGWNAMDKYDPDCTFGCGEDHPIKYVSWYDTLAYANRLSLDESLTACYVFSNVSCKNGGSVGSNYMNCFDSDSTKGGIESATVLTSGASKPQDCEGYRLPTEAEWEYAVRVGNQYTAFYQSDGNDGTITYTDCTLDDNLDQIGWYCGNNGSTGTQEYGTKPVGGNEANAWGLYDMSGNVYEWVWDRYQSSYETDVETDPVGSSTGSYRVLRGGVWSYYAQGCRSAYRNYHSPSYRYNHIGLRLCRSRHPLSCTPDPCNGHGTCDDTNGYALCDCHTGYDGADCSVCAPHYTGYPDCKWDGTFPEGYCDANQCWPVPPTGQTICYNNEVSIECSAIGGTEPPDCDTAYQSCTGLPDSPSDECFCGQDAQYADNSRTYTCYNAAGAETPCANLSPASEDEVVTDSLTGLMWQRWLPEIYEGCTGGDPVGSQCGWQEAIDYCETLNEGEGYGGFTDWQLPTPHELRSTADDGRYSPAIDNTAFPGTPYGFWSSSSFANNTSGAWGVFFYNGSVVDNIKSDYFYARCVRSGPEDSVIGSFDHLIISGSEEQIVTDVVTGLIWQKAYVSGKTWQEALAYCEELDYANQTDWRLPDKNELSSLVNYEIYSPASDFPDMPMVSFWSSSSRAGNTSDACFVDFNCGFVNGTDKTDYNDARCVRAGP